MQLWRTISKFHANTHENLSNFQLHSYLKLPHLPTSAPSWNHTEKFNYVFQCWNRILCNRISLFDICLCCFESDSFRIEFELISTSVYRTDQFPFDIWNWMWKTAQTSAQSIWSCSVLRNSFDSKRKLCQMQESKKKSFRNHVDSFLFNLIRKQKPKMSTVHLCKNWINCVFDCPSLNCGKRCHDKVWFRNQNGERKKNYNGCLGTRICIELNTVRCNWSITKRGTKVVFHRKPLWLKFVAFETVDAGPGL